MVLGVSLPAEGAAGFANSSGQRRGGPRERVQHGLSAVGKQADQLVHERVWLLRGVTTPIRISLRDYEYSVLPAAVPRRRPLGVKCNQGLVAHSRAISGVLRHPVGFYPDACTTIDQARRFS